MFGLFKKNTPKVDNSQLYREQAQRDLEDTRNDLAEMNRALDVMGERLKQGQLSAAAIAARNGGFSSHVTRRLDDAQRLTQAPTWSERTSVDGLQGPEREKVARKEVAEAGEYARHEHKQLANKAKQLRKRLEKM